MKCDVDIRRISMLIHSCQEVPPCTWVLLTVCRRRSLPLLLQPLRSRSLLHLRGSTPSGSEDPSSLHFPPSNRCGSQSRSMMSVALPLSTGNAFKYLTNNSFCQKATNLLDRYKSSKNKVI